MSARLPLGLLLLIYSVAQITAIGAALWIENRDYPNDAAAQAAWVPMGGTAPVSVTAAGAGKALRLPCNFAGTDIERASWDRKVQLDLSSCRGVEFEVLCRDASPVSYFSIYFQSGAGWYHTSFYPESDTTWNTITVDKAGAAIEGQPAGWGQISTIRISAWRGKAKDTEFLIRGLRQTDVLGADANIAIVRAESAATRDRGEARNVEQFTETVAKELRGFQLGCAVLSDLELTAARLKGAQVVILPYNPALPPSAATEIANYIKTGGKVLAFYTLPDPLRSLFGIETTAHFKPPRPGYLSSIHFREDALPGAPKVVGQTSWNITDVKPVSGTGRVLAEWYDEKGEPTGHAAVLGSANTLFMTHVLLPDDPANKRQMLLALVGRLAPDVWKKAAEASLENCGKIASYQNFEEAVKGIGKTGAKEARVETTLKAARDLRQQGATLIAQSRYAEAMQKSAAAVDEIQQAFCLAQRPLAGEFRAFWCHSAFGVEGIEWDEAIRRLARNGFTAILPNMLWGGAAFYESGVLPVAAQVRERGDQIAKCVAACRKYGVQIHVWKVNWNLGRAAPTEFVERMRGEGRLQRDAQGKEEPWLCPSHPLNQQLEIDSMVELARKYDLDGIHFDYIRYPDGEHCYCAGCKERFEKLTGSKLQKWPQDVLTGGSLRQEWLEWRRSNITKVVAAVSQQARAARPKIKISAAVFPNWDRDRDTIGQDWKLWCEKGYLDFVCPMDYTTSNRSFENMVANQVAWAGRVPCYPGIGVSASRSKFGPDRVIEQINITRQHGARGFTIFNYAVPESRDLLPLLGLGITAKR